MLILRRLLCSSILSVRGSSSAQAHGSVSAASVLWELGVHRREPRVRPLAEATRLPVSAKASRLRPLWRVTISAAVGTSRCGYGLEIMVTLPTTFSILATPHSATTIPFLPVSRLHRGSGLARLLA